MMGSGSRVVVYARVSTEHEAQMSALENQVDWYKPILSQHPEWTLVGIYIDRGVTGTSVKKRPHFMQMIEDAESGNFDLILTREVSRFARNTVDTLEYTRRLKKYGVGVYFINDNIDTMDKDGELRLTIMSSLAQEESRKISDRVKSGQKTSMEKSVIYGNGNIMGYNRVGQNVVINPEQAKVVKMIFEMYLQGYGLKQIKYRLEQLGIKTSMGKDVWSESTISRMLKNRFYYGTIEYRKQIVLDYLEQKRANNHGQVDRIISNGKYEPIISKEDFDRVQEILKSKRQKIKGYNGAERVQGSKPVSSVWGRLLVCECGHKFGRRTWGKTANGKQYGYQCYSQARNGTKNERNKKGLPTENFCSAKMFPEWQLQMMVKYIFRTYLRDVDTVIEAATEILKEHISDKAIEADNTVIIEHLQQKVERLEHRLDNLLTMRSDGEITKEQYIKKKSETERELEELQKSLSELLPPDTDKEDELSYNEKLKIMIAALNQYLDFDSDDDIPELIVEAFVAKIVVHEKSFDWYLRYCGNEFVVNCNVEGNKRSSRIVENGSLKTPPFVGCNTGCYR